VQPRVQVLLAPIEHVDADVIVLPARRAHDDGGRVVRIAAPRWRMPDGPDRLLAEAYRDALRAAGRHHARSLAVPAILARGPWPLAAVTRIALDVFDSNLTDVRQVWIAANTPAMVERWAEALVAHPRISGHGRWR
jgi:O-acetyl-ADP-ribose deacetylase (regulator of RNase III)